MKKNIAHITFFLTSCIAEVIFYLFPRRQIVVPPRHLGQHIDGVLEITVYFITDVRAITFCFLVKTNAADPRSVLIDLEAIVLSLPLQVFHCRADAVAKLDYSRRVLNLVVRGHIEA